MSNACYQCIDNIHTLSSQHCSSNLHHSQPVVAEIGVLIRTAIPAIAAVQEENGRIKTSLSLQVTTSPPA
jgi:hypothetical protein